MQPTDPHSDERQRRWRLLLGEPAGQLCKLGQDDLVIDRALAAVYDPEGLDGSKRRGGLDGSSPQVARWLGDIRQFFPSPVVRILQQDAVTRLQLERLLLEPEMLQAVEPDVHLVATLLKEL